VANAFPHQEAPEPTADEIKSALGPANKAWRSLLETLDADGIGVVWKWYRDGGWLARATKGSKTILWARIDEAGFVDGSCYFAARLRDALADFPGLTPQQATDIRTAKLWGKQVPVPFELRTVADVKAIKPIVEAKLKLK